MEKKIETVETNEILEKGEIKRKQEKQSHESQLPPSSQPSQLSPSSQQSNSNSCLITGCVAGCGCLVLATIVFILTVFFGGQFAYTFLKNSGKTAAGVPEPIVKVIEMVVGNNKGGQEFLKVLKDGVPTETPAPDATEMYAPASDTPTDE